MNLPDPTPVQYEIADYLQDGGQRLIVQAFRGCGKSWITSAYVLWCLYHDPQEKILVVSASKTRSDDFSTFTQRLIKEVPILQHLAPTGDQRQSKIAFDVGPADASHAPSVKSAGIFGQLAGSRATRIIADDVEVPNNSATEDMREKLLRAVGEFEAILIPEGRTQIIFLGTPQTEESIYNKLSGERGYPCRIWPVRVPEVGKEQNYKGNLAPSIMVTEESAWTPIEPTRFDNDKLNQRMAAYGRSGFMLQFMLDTSLSDAEKYPLKLGDLIVAHLDAEEPPTRISYASGPDQLIKDFPQIGFSGDRWYRPLLHEYKHSTSWNSKILAIDPSGRGADQTAYSVVGHFGNKLFLLEAGGMREVMKKRPF